jgi:hypothetical protein
MPFIFVPENKIAIKADTTMISEILTIPVKKNVLIKAKQVCFLKIGGKEKKNINISCNKNIL